MDGTTLAEGLELSGQLLGRYLVGFSDANHTSQAPGLPNHVAWSLGHLAMTMHRVAERLDGGPMPESDFITSAKGDASKYGTETVAFGSQPTADPSLYPPYARCLEIFNSAVTRLSVAARASDAAKLAAPTPWSNGTTTLGALVARMAFHNGMHCGQIADLRRALKLGSIFK
jgi:hypothetical protein